MRNYTTEEIEKYLEGSFSLEEQKAFQKELENNKSLKEEVELQSKLVKRMGVLSFALAIQSAQLRNIGVANSAGSTASSASSKVAGSVSGASKLSTLGGWTAVKILSIITLATTSFFGVKYLINKSNESINENVTLINTPDLDLIDTVVVEETERKNSKKWNDLPQSVSFNTYRIKTNEPSVITDKRSGAVINIPANSLINRRTGEVIEGAVDVSYREFRNISDVALSGIPMDYKDGHFITAGMFEIRAFQKGDTLDVKKGEKVTIDFNMLHAKPGIGFYELDDKTQEWKKLSEITSDDVPVKSKAVYDKKETLLEDDLFVGNSYRSEPMMIKVKEEDDLVRFKGVMDYKGDKLNLSNGFKILQLASLTCGHCQEMARDIVSLSNGRKERLNHTIIAYGSAFDKASFIKNSNLNDSIDVFIKEYDDYKKLIGEGDMGQLFLIKDGVVLKKWENENYESQELFDWLENNPMNSSLANYTPETIEEALNYQLLKSGGLEEKKKTLVIDNPKPLNDTTEIEFDLATATDVEIKEQLKKEEAEKWFESEENKEPLTQTNSTSGKVIEGKLLVTSLLDNEGISLDEEGDVRNTAVNILKKTVKNQKVLGADEKGLSRRYPLKILSGLEVVQISDDSEESFFTEFKALDKWVFTTLDKQSLARFITTPLDVKPDYTTKTGYLEDRLSNGVLDIKVVLDNKAENKFDIVLKREAGLDTLSVKLIMKNKQKDGFESSYAEYKKMRQERVLRTNQDIKKSFDQIKKLKSEIEKDEKYLDSLITSGNDELYNTTRLIMTEEELEMSKEEWYEYSNNNPEIKNRIKTLLSESNGAEDKVEFYERLTEEKNTKEREIKAKKIIKRYAQLSKEMSLNALLKVKYDSARVLMTKRDLKLREGNWLQGRNRNINYYSQLSEKLFKIKSNYRNELDNLRNKYRELLTEIQRERVVAISNPGHRRDVLIRKLEIEGFGVYNCDQVRRIKNPIKIDGVFKVGTRVIKAMVCYVLDQKANGSFSFNPHAITCNPKSNTNLVVYDDEGNIFFYDSASWLKSHPIKNGKFEFNMRDISDSVTNSADLEKLIWKKTSAVIKTPF